MLITLYNCGTQHSTNSFANLPSYPPDNCHSSDNVYWRGRVLYLLTFNYGASWVMIINKFWEQLHGLLQKIWLTANNGRVLVTKEEARCLLSTEEASKWNGMAFNSNHRSIRRERLHGTEVCHCCCCTDRVNTLILYIYSHAVFRAYTMTATKKWWPQTTTLTATKMMSLFVAVIIVAISHGLWPSFLWKSLTIV